MNEGLGGRREFWSRELERGILGIKVMLKAEGRDEVTQEVEREW